MDKKYMSVKEVSQYLGISIWTIYRLTSKKSITHRKIGAKILFNKEELDIWIDKFKVETKEDADGCQKS